MHRTGPLAIAGVHILLAVASRSPEIKLQYRIAAIRQPLRVTVVTPLVTAPRTAMHELHHGQALRFHSRWRGQITVEFHAIAGRELDRFHRRKFVFFKLRPIAE